MIITTMNDIPGYEIDEVFGEVFGLTVRSRNIGSQMGAGLKSMLGGELKGMTKALVESRRVKGSRLRLLHDFSKEGLWIDALLLHALHQLHRGVVEFPVGEQVIGIQLCDDVGAILASLSRGYGGIDRDGVNDERAGS